DLLADTRFVACRDNSIHEFLQNHAYRANRVIVAGDRVIDDVWIRVRVHDGNHWNPEAPGFVHGILFTDGIDYHESVGQLRHVDYSVEVAPELCGFAIKRRQL